MATIKSYSDLDQSRKLAEILPLESADQTWERITSLDAAGELQYGQEYKHNGDIPFQLYSGIGVPCWSLNSLIYILPDTITDEDGTIFGLNIKKNFIEYYNPSMGALCATYHSIIAEDLVDAVYEMILKLHELKKL